MVAIYVRQSVDKKDSISIESQIETCRRKLSPEEEALSEVFSDRGYSGKNTARPEFQRMMSLIREGVIKKVVVYKLDRISRSTLNFAEIRDVFEQHDVEFISHTENFDTSTIMGKAMLSIVMVFAEMERETIQQRITDNYYARGEQGRYLGGYPPFGYNKVDFIMGGKKTYCYEINQTESEMVIYLYEQFASREMSKGELVRELNAKGILTRRGGAWNTTGLTRVLSNPAYVKSDESIYTYLKTKELTINNQVDEFIGTNGCYTYGKTKEVGGKKVQLENSFVTIAPHEGIIDSSLWLAVQERLNGIREYSNHSNIGRTLSWLQGLVKCRCCDYSMYVKHMANKNPEKRFYYFFCRGKRNKTCKADPRMMPMGVLESEVERLIRQRLEELRNAKASSSPVQDVKLNTLKIERHKMQEQIDNLIEQVVEGTAIAKHIDSAVEKLEVKLRELDTEISQHEARQSRVNTVVDVDDVMRNWSGYSIERKNKIATIFVERILVNGLDVEIIMA